MWTWTSRGCVTVRSAVFRKLLGDTRPPVCVQVKDPSLYNTWRKQDAIPLSSWMARMYHPTRNPHMDSKAWTSLNTTQKDNLHQVTKHNTFLPGGDVCVWVHVG